MYFVVLFLLFLSGFVSLFIFTTNMLGYYIILWVFVSIIAALLLEVIYCLLLIEIGAKTSPKSKLKVFHLRNALWFAFKFYHIKVTSEGKENIPNETFVIYSNHKSMLDPAAIYVELNMIISAIGKKSLFGFWPMNRITKCFGALPMDRENNREAAKNMIAAIKAVKDGLSMIIFPEGGIKTRDVEEMVELKAGAYKLAMKAEAPIVPCTIIGSSAISKEKRTKKKEIHIIFHKPITKEEYKGKTTLEVGTLVENLINEDIKNYEKK